MARADYLELVPDIQDLIDDNGRLVSFVRIATTAADALKPWKKAALTTGNTVTTRVPACFVPPSGMQLGSLGVTDDMLKRVDQVCLVAPHNSVDLSNSQKLIDGGLSWAIEWVETLKPGDVVLLYAFGVKR